MSGSRIGFISLAALAILGSGGCSFFPVSGPSSADIESGYSETVPYHLIKLTSETIDTLAAHEPKGLAGAFTDRRPSQKIVFGVGDVISTTIFEAAAGGLFIPLEAGVRPGNFVNLPDQIIDNDGNISIPYAGLIKAAGRDNVQVQNDIVNKIKNRAIEPQVVISLSQQRTSLISVVGSVNTPLRFAVPMTGAGDRVLDAITRAGGISGPGYATWVMLERGGRRATVPFENLVMDAKNNIYILPGDRIYVYQEQQKFIAFGAMGINTAGFAQSQVTFDAWRLNLAEAVAKAGGLGDVQADPGAVFLYRQEPREVALLLGADLTRFSGPLVPVVFQIDFRDPGGYFLATRLQMRNDDIIFVANAHSYEANKVLNFISNVAGTAIAAQGAVQGVPVTSAIVHGHELAAAPSKTFVGPPGVINTTP
ncbi:polysaccharide export protein [Methylocapsa sp. D3K7]|uniref:polysaccharide biosynthesis/export family protein n=1 Tax=Methylocapsa sp. D3K7 TaxID=3041435 RepID=UPI00244EB8E5|nr:polysaccharide biosynthesis/export family protein [Methylocapsa sp. D3K7]WGJ13982.1 polysaccharide export protein [Methylocapsa sp. D3K7]